MDPLTLGISAAAQILRLVDWHKVAESLATDGVRDGAKGLLKRLKPAGRDEAARQAITLFVEEFHRELEDKLPLTAALPAYDDQIKRLVESAAPDIAAWMQPETKDVDLAPVERMWGGLGLDSLPEDFDWPLVAQSFARAIRKHVKKDPKLRAMLDTALQEQIAESIDRLAGPSPGFDLPGYREFLRKKCGALQLAVMHTSTYRYDRQITLWSVFVPQSARESVPVRDLPRDLLQRLREEGQIATARDERDIDELRQHYQESAVLPVLDVLARERLVVILGDPGSGKTSLLKFLVMRWVTTDQAPFPLWIDLKEYAQERNGLLKYCESGCATYGLDAREVEKRLQAGDAAVYLDGLDEIFDGPTRGRVIEELAAFTARYPRATVVVTSRHVGYELERLRNAGFTHATLEHFDDPQVSEFLRKWHDAAEDGAAERARLIAQLDRAFQESRAVRDLAGNPLLLTMMAILNRNQDLPRDRVELYREASRVLLHEWDSSRSLPDDTFARQDKEELLRELAGTMQQAEGGLAGNLIDRARLVDLFRTFLKNLGVPSPHDKATALVQQLTERNFILCYAGADRFSFVHRTFLEYFCAAWFVDLFQKKQTLTLDQLKNDVFGPHWKDETWHEVLRLIAGMLGEKQAEQLILFLMEQDGRNDKLANLMLAAGCLSEVRNRRAIQKTDEDLRRRFVEKVIRYDPPYYYEPYIDWSEIVPTRQKAVGLMAFVWRSERIRVWLRSSAEHDVDWIVRMAAVAELVQGWKDDPETLPVLKDRAHSDQNDNVRSAALHELARGWKDDPETLRVLKDRARSDQNDNVRSAAVHELAQGWKDDPETLPILKDRAHQDQGVRSAAVQELARGWKDDPDTLIWLKDRARSNEFASVRSAAVRELAKGWRDDPDTLPWLKDRASSDEDAGVQSAALQELARGWKDDPDTLPMLKDRSCSDGNQDVRSAAVQELAFGWRDDPDTLPFLKDRARSDEDAGVRIQALQELARGWKDDPDTLPFLSDLAGDAVHANVRVAAVRELARGWKDAVDTLTILKDSARSDESEEVRRAATRELARGWRNDPDTLPILKDRARSDTNAGVRSWAVLDLARGWEDDPDTLPILRDRARSDEDATVRRAALQELARGWKDDSHTLPILKGRARSDDDPFVRMAAVEELARGWKDDPDTLSILKDRACSNEYADVRWMAMEELARGWKDDPDTPALLKDRARSDKHEHVRGAALRELARGWKDDPETLPILKDHARSDEHEFVRKSALLALARHWKDDPEVIAILAAQPNPDSP
jgi:predicted NACHT family NTPase